MNLTEAFKALDNLEEDVFSVNDEGIEKLQNFVKNDDSVDELSVYDLELEDEREDTEDCHVGDAVLDCCVCHSKLFKPVSEIVVDEETQVANVGDECPYCYSVDGYKVVGEVKPMGEDDESSDEVEISDTEVTEDIDQVDISTDDVDIEIEDKDDEIEEVAEDKLDESIYSLMEATKDGPFFKDFEAVDIDSVFNNYYNKYNIDISKVEPFKEALRDTLRQVENMRLDEDNNPVPNTFIIDFPLGPNKNKISLQLSKERYYGKDAYFGTLRTYTNVRNMSILVGNSFKTGFRKQENPTYIRAGNLDDLKIWTANELIRSAAAATTYGDQFKRIPKEDTQHESVDLLTKENTIASLLKDNMSELASIIDVNELRERIIELVDNSDIAGKPAAQKLKRDLYSKKSAGALLSTITTYMTGDKVIKTGKYKKAANESVKARKIRNRTVKESSDITLEAKYEIYPDGRITSTRVTGNDEFDAFANLLDEVGSYVTSDDVLDMQDEGATIEDVVKQIQSMNGDGSDFIFSIKNITTGKKYFDLNESCKRKPIKESEITWPRNITSDKGRAFISKLNDLLYNKYRFAGINPFGPGIVDGLDISKNQSKKFTNFTVYFNDVQPVSEEKLFGDNIDKHYSNFKNDFTNLVSEFDAQKLIISDFDDKFHTVRIKIPNEWLMTESKSSREYKEIIKESDSNEETIGDKLKKYQMWVDYDMEHYGKVSETTQDIIDKEGLQLIKDQYGDYEVSVGHYKAESFCKSKKGKYVKEDIDEIEISSDDMEIKVKPKDEECEECEEETVGPVSEETIDEIEINNVDKDMVDEVTEECLKENFNNVKFFRSNNITKRNNKLIVEGVIGFKSGKKKNTKFMFESYKTNRDKVVFLGENKDVTKNKSLSLVGKVVRGKLISESMKLK